MSSNKQNLKKLKSNAKNVYLKGNYLKVNEQDEEDDIYHSESNANTRAIECKREPQVICIQDDQSAESHCQPMKKIKEELFERSIQRDPFFNGQKVTFKDCLRHVNMNGDLKVLRLNHFFKREGQIYFEVMVGRNLEKILRQPQIMSLSSLVQNKETKRMVYCFIASTYKSVITEEQLSNDLNDQEN